MCKSVQRLSSGIEAMPLPVFGGGLLVANLVSGSMETYEIAMLLCLHVPLVVSPLETWHAQMLQEICISNLVSILSVLLSQLRSQLCLLIVLRLQQALLQVSIVAILAVCRF